MRVVNDRTGQSGESVEFNLGEWLVQVVITTFGISTVIFAPLPMIVNHLRLKGVWPKLASLVSAILALGVLQMPFLTVAIAFVFGLFVAEQVSRDVPLWHLVFSSSVIALGAGGGLLFLSAYVGGLSPLNLWTQLVDQAIASFKISMPQEVNFQWDLFRGIFLYEGPFLYLAVAILSVWLSVGMVAHLGWLDEYHCLSGKALRATRLPMTISLVFIGLFFPAYLTENASHYIWEGIFLVAGTLMFIQGCISLSYFLELKRCHPRMRTLIYWVSIIIGFYMVVGVGTLSPWLVRKKRTEERNESNIA